MAYAIDVENYNNFLKDLECLDSFLENEWFSEIQTIRNVRMNCAVPRHPGIRRRFNPLSDLKELQFRKKYRFSKDNMRKIIEMVRDDLEVDLPAERSANQVPVELQIMAAIRYWGLSEEPDVTANAHGVSSRTLLKICKRVASALAAKASRYIRMPATLADKERVTSAFQTLAGMPQVIGTVMHHTVYLKRPTSGGNCIEKHLHIQIVSDANLRICDQDCRIRSVKETNHEMFCQSRIKERFEQNEFRGRVLLGNESLPCTAFLFPPVEVALSPEEHAFNRSHSVTFSLAIKCLNVWVQRFGVLGSEIPFSFGTAKQTIVALALLHNMAVEWNDPAFDNTVNGFSRDCCFVETSTLNPSSTSTLVNVDCSARHEFIKNFF